MSKDNYDGAFLMMGIIGVVFFIFLCSIRDQVTPKSMRIILTGELVSVNGTDYIKMTGINATINPRPRRDYVNYYLFHSQENCTFLGKCDVNYTISSQNERVLNYFEYYDNQSHNWTVLANEAIST